LPRFIGGETSKPGLSNSDVAADEDRLGTRSR
jgi:hypothetical protein